MSRYVPTTQQVEDGFAHEPEYEYHNPVGYGAHVQGNRRAFRRWLAAHDAEVAAKALEDAAEKFGENQMIREGDVKEWLRARAAEYRKAVE